MERKNNSVDSFKKDIFSLFDEICDIIVEEKGQVSEDEIQQLVEMLRNKVKEKHITHSDSLKLKKNNKSENLKFNSDMTIMSDLENANLGRTQKALEAITDKMSNYIIQEKGEIIEQDILDIANQLRQFSSVTITEKTCLSSNQLLCKSDVEKTESGSSTPESPKSPSIGNINFKKFIESNNTVNSSFYSCVSFSNEPQKDNLDCEHKEKDNVDNKEKNLETNARGSAKLNGNIKRKEKVAGKFNKKQNDEQKNISKKVMSHPNKPGPTNDEPGATNNEVVNFDHASKNKKHLDLSTLSTNHHQDLSQNNRKARRKWKLDKNDVIVVKTTNYINSVISTEEKSYPQQETITDISERLSVLFSNVIDVILEKFNIRGEDVEKIANLMLQYRGRTNNNPLNEFITVTPEIPRWALRGYLNKVSNGLPNAKLVSSLLNKVAEYIVHQNGQILQSDRSKFCTILAEKLLHQIYPKDIKNHISIPQKHKTNLKIKKSELQINSAKLCESISPRPNTELERSKRTFITHKTENFSSPVGLIKNVKAIDKKQTLSIDAAIEEGIRSLEYIKQLSERLLSDFDDNPQLKNENLRKGLPIQLRISQNKSLPFQTTNLEYNKGKRKVNFSDGKHQYCTNYKENNHKIKGQSRNCSLRSTVADQKVEVVKINRSKTSRASSANYYKSEQVNRIVKLQSKRIQSNNDHFGENELQTSSKEFSQTIRSNRNNSAPLIRCQTDVKRYIKTSRAVCKSQEVNNYSRLINRKIRSDQQNDGAKQKGICKKINESGNNNEQKEEETLERMTNQFDSFLDIRDEGKPKKSVSQEVILKVSRTYSVFKPLLSNIKNNIKAANAGYKPYQSNSMQRKKNENRFLKRTENITNFVKEKYFNSKIPIRTYYLSKGIALTEK